MKNVTSKEGWIHIKGPFSVKELQYVGSFKEVDKLSITHHPLLTVAVSKGFRFIKSIRQLWLWCDITRAAMRSVISLPGLEVLDILRIKHPGQLVRFTEAATLKVFRCNCCLSEDDIIEITRCNILSELGLQSSALTIRSLMAIMEMPRLKSLDIEGTAFDDTMAEIIRESDTLQSLEVGATRLTKKGLKHLCQMKQLRSLDLWATHITENDLKLLSNLPELEYLSVGGPGNCIDANNLFSILEGIPSLEKIWLCEINLTKSQKVKFEARYKETRFTT